MLVHDDLGFMVNAVEVRTDKVDLGLHRSQVFLCSSLQDETRSEFCKVGDSGDIEKNVFRQDVCQPGEYLFAAPALPLEIDNVGLHEHRAAVAEDRHGVGGESDIGVLLHLVTERLGGTLQKVAVSGRALGVEFEVLDATVLQHDQLNVLAADIHDDVGILVELHGRFSVRHSFHQRDIGLEHVFQDVLGVSRRADTKHFQGCSLRLHLVAESHEHVNSVLDGIPVRQLVGLAQHIARFREQYSFRRGRTAVKADESAHGFTDTEVGANKSRDRVFLLEAGEFFLGGAQTSGPRLRLFSLPADGDVVLEALGAHVDTDLGLFVLAKLHGAQRGEVLRVFRNFDQVFRFGALRKLDFALLPGAGNVLLPRFFHAANERIGTSQ